MPPTFTRVVAIGIGIILFSSSLAVVDLSEYWAVPVGSGFRPMGAGFHFLFLGCGTPVIVLLFSSAGFWQV